MTSGEWDLRALRALEEEERLQFRTISEPELLNVPPPPQLPTIDEFCGDLNSEFGGSTTNIDDLHLFEGTSLIPLPSSILQAKSKIHSHPFNHHHHHHFSQYQHQNPLHHAASLSSKILGSPTKGLRKSGATVACSTFSASTLKSPKLLAKKKSISSSSSTSAASSAAVAATNATAIRLGFKPNFDRYYSKSSSNLQQEQQTTDNCFSQLTRSATLNRGRGRKFASKSFNLKQPKHHFPYKVSTPTVSDIRLNALKSNSSNNNNNSSYSKNCSGNSNSKNSSSTALKSNLANLKKFSTSLEDNSKLLGRKSSLIGGSVIDSKEMMTMMMFLSSTAPPELSSGAVATGCLDSVQLSDTGLTDLNGSDSEGSGGIVGIGGSALSSFMMCGTKTSAVGSDDGSIIYKKNKNSAAAINGTTTTTFTLGRNINKKSPGLNSNTNVCKQGHRSTLPSKGKMTIASLSGSNTLGGSIMGVSNMGTSVGGGGGGGGGGSIGVHSNTCSIHSRCHNFSVMDSGDSGNGNTNRSDIIDYEIENHIKHCSCACNHMGYGNSMDYQTTGFGGLPDVTEHSNIKRSASHQDSISNSESTEISSLQKSSKSKSIKSSSLQHRSSGGINSSGGSSSVASLSSKRKFCIFSFTALTALVVCAAVATVFVYQLIFMVPSRNSHDERIKIVRKILKEIPLIDGHNDLAWNVRKYAHSSLELLDVQKRNHESDHNTVWHRPQWSQTDITRLKDGLVGAQIWSAYVPCEAQGLDAVQLALEQIDIIQRFADLHTSETELVVSSEEIIAVHRRGMIASMIGIEGGHALGSSLGVLRSFHSLGARYITLTHHCDVTWAGSSSMTMEKGLTNFGKAVIKEMNRLGMLIDLSYSSDATARDVFEATRAPVIYSHSAARALCNSTRNVPDDMLRTVAENGGLIMVSFDSEYVTCGDPATIHDVIAHIKHIRAIAGVEHIGIGAGYDGIERPPIGLEDVSKYPNLFATLLEDPNWSEEDLAKLAGKNFLRVMESVEHVRDYLKHALQPVEITEPIKKSQCTFMSPS